MEHLLSNSPVARDSDPVSSHLAAKEITGNGKRASQQRIALDAVLDHQGCTSLELSQTCALDRYQLARRLPELEEYGLVEKGPIRPCSIGKRPAVTWFLIYCGPRG
jgi:hypothetical protein